MVAWLTLSTTGPATEDHPVLEGLRQEHPQLFRAPGISPWPSDLPPAKETPRDGRCFDLEGHELGRGSWVPHALDRVIQRRLLDLEEYPGRAQAGIDAIVPEVVQAVVDRVAAGPPTGYRWTTVLAWTVGGLLVGVVTGAVLAR